MRGNDVSQGNSTGKGREMRVGFGLGLHWGEKRLEKKRGWLLQALEVLQKVYCIIRKGKLPEGLKLSSLGRMRGKSNTFRMYSAAQSTCHRLYPICLLLPVNPRMYY